MSQRQIWTASENAMLRKLYPHKTTTEVAQRMGRSIGKIYQHAAKLGVKKSDVYLASPAACRLRRGDEVGKAYRFKKGLTPFNKGLRRPGWGPGRMKQTQFKKGERRGMAAKNWVPVGTVKTDADGFLRIKVRDAKAGENTGYGNSKVWPMMNRHLWEQHKGPIPAGHIVAFKDGNRKNCIIENLELMTRSQNMKRNSYHNYGPEIARAIQLVGAVQRQINRKLKRAEQ